MSSRIRSLLSHADPKWTEDMLVYALRYTLGRSSYAPGVCQDYLRPLIPHFSKKALCVMIRDIQEALADTTFGPLPYADEWGKLLRDMEAELENRKRQK